MNYRKFGNTGVEISALGFGTMRLPTTDGVPLSANIDEKEAIRLIRHAIDSGVNYVDTAYPYHGRTSETLVGKALADGYREKVYLATKSPVVLIEAEGDFDRILDEQLQKLNTDHVDFYLLHALDKKKWETVKKFNLLDKMKKARDAGKIRFMGFSFHDDLELFKTIVDSFDQWDFCQIQFNYINTDYQAGLEGLHYAAGKGLGVVIMEPLLGGALAAPSDALKNALSPEKSPVEWALDYLWNQPEVSLLLSGMGEMQQVEDNLTYASRSSVGMLSEKEVAMLAHAKEVYDSSILVPCTRCSYCMPCPFGLNIPAIYQAYNATSQSTMERAKTLYATATPEVSAIDCRKCRRCENVCPQHIPSSELMPKIAEVFGR
ncbi:aldo/keto reductase [Merdimmobilis hominis]|uniref:aldo/keto reductase n=1 Tax=Merdimmobilis hominis TaxID=2897707 RepID=UPI0006C7E2CF|nr:aldo/keto reductase [Merdimmobilis hominis]PWL58214.1 MAG: aldo/keto reductase [Oscillospiraceae bacterium]PWL62268.1 MAG: aldo/keto reductase [Oscillospiraceae bacterium]